MDHRRMKEKIWELYDGELPGDERSEVQSHLASCTECRSLVGGWKQTASTLFKTPEVSVPFRFAENVLERIESAQTARPAWFRISWPAPAFALAAAALILMVPVSPALSMEALLSDVDEAGWNTPADNDGALGFLMEGDS